MLNCFNLIPERYGRTDGQICYINIAHQHTALLTRDKNGTTEYCGTDRLFPALISDLENHKNITERCNSDQKSLSKRMVHEGCWVKLGSIDRHSLLKRIDKTGTNCPATTASTNCVRRAVTRTLRRWRTSCSVRRTSQKITDQLVRFAWDWHSPFKCAQ